MAEGQVVRQAKTPHGCAPGWEWRLFEDDEAAPFPGARYGHAPDPWRFPKGTVWRRECGRTWVSLGSPQWNEPGRCVWRPEGRFERWRRERRERRDG